MVRCPGSVPAGARSDALQSLVDLAPTFLTAAGIDVPGRVQGVNQWDVWRGRSARARDHVLVENRHQPTAVHLRTYVDERHKLTVYRERPHGELFDLHEDPHERRNLWDDPGHADLRHELLRRFVDAELRREPLAQPRVAGA